MSERRHLLAPDRGQAAIPLRLVTEDSFDTWLGTQSELVRSLAAAQKFRGRKNTLLIAPRDTTGHWEAIVGLGKAKEAGRWSLAHAASRLPAGTYRVEGAEATPQALHGWLMAQYGFDRYRKPKEAEGARVLLVRDQARIDHALIEADADALVRTLVETPANDMGPAELEQAIRDIADTCGARVTSVAGEALLSGNFPAIHAVGRASPRAPRLITMEWGSASHPKLAIVGKGICFDTGGLNLKPGGSMALMKKDMGGAAHALALAQAIIRKKLPVHVRLVVAAADNAVSGDAMRPGDILHTRKGITVEVGNTDAEGRLVLADALAHASEWQPDLLLDFATLTGAARVALGPDLPALFTNDDGIANRLLGHGIAREDPLWRLPLWAPYRRLFRSRVADTNNVSEGGFAGAIIAGLFLQKFVGEDIRWAHMDIYAWRPGASPGRPKGAAAMAIHACLALVEELYQ